MNLKETAAGKRATKMRESVTAAWKRVQEHDLKSLGAQIKGQIGVDIEDPEVAELLDFSSPAFSIKGFREAVYRYCRANSAAVREASAEGALQQLLRSGIQMAVNKEYQAVETNFEEIVNPISSTKAIELYAPLYRAGFMQPIDEGDEPPRLSAKGADIQIRNKKTAAIFEVTEEMWEDDQTSQIQEQANQIGENGKILKDSRVFVRWLGVAGTDAGGSAVPASQTGAQAGESTWPFNAAFTNGGGQNRLTTYTAFGYQALINLRQLARKMLDPKGNKMLVQPDTVVAGSALTDPLNVLLKSENWPSTGSMSPGGSGTTTGIGTTFAKNILQGAYNPVTSIWLPDLAYGLFQAGKGLRLQQRRPLRVIQESPVSGPAFTASVFRFKIDERYEVDWTEPRFAVLGSNGSV